MTSWLCGGERKPRRNTPNMAARGVTWTLVEHRDAFQSLNVCQGLWVGMEAKQSKNAELEKGSNLFLGIS